MKKIFLIFFGLMGFFSHFAYADSFPKPSDDVVLQVNAERWVKTQTAQLVVELNATLDKSGMVQVRKQMLEKLNKIASNAEWHITRFDRSQDQSGLEKIQASAEARLPAEQLSSVRDMAKNVSKPGETYTIAEINFAPSLADIEQARSDVRNDMYAKIQKEVDALNKAYPQQHYHVHRIDFISNVYSMTVQAPVQRGVMLMGATPAAKNMVADNFAISEKVQLSGRVILSSDISHNSDNDDKDKKEKKG